jgi:hypothetical protein
VNDILRINEENKKMKLLSDKKVMESQKDFIMSNNNLKLEN